jgi:hypothetical protein
MAPTTSLPLAYALTVSTTSIQVLPPNPSRRGIAFFNPGPNSIAVCPSLSNTLGATTAVVGGAGSITILPANMLVMPPVGWPDAVATVGWNAIAGGANSPFTAFEF